jgi:TolB-like protein
MTVLDLRDIFGLQDEITLKIITAVTFAPSNPLT